MAVMKPPAHLLLLGFVRHLGCVAGFFSRMLRDVLPRDSDAVTRSVSAPCAHSRPGQSDWLLTRTSA